MPKLYGRHKWLRYWYAPLALAIAIAVAFGTVRLGEMLLGGDEGVASAPSSSPSPTPAAPSPTATASQPSPTATAQATVRPTPSAAALGGVRIGEMVVVAGTGDCLNVRSSAGRSNPAVGCVPDGAVGLVLSGPDQVDGLKWWLVRFEGAAEGWAADDYLRAAPPPTPGPGG